MIEHRQKKEAETTMERRTLFTRMIRWAAGISGLTFLIPLVRFVSHKVPRKPQLIEVAAPLPASGVHTGHDFLLFVTDQQPLAVSRICTHLGCRVNYLGAQGIIECPCHQSRFTTSGQRIAGPAEKNLPRYEVSLKKDAQGQVTAYVVHL